jgi:FkbM family methyltransferase
MIICAEGEYGPFLGAAEDEVVHGHYREHGVWEPELLELLTERLFPEGRGTFLDLGANIGLISIPLAVRRDVSCYAFEPEPLNYELLCRNAAAHAVSQKIKTFNLALYSEKTTLSFELSAENYGDHRVRVREPDPGETHSFDESTRKVIQVPAERLDDLLCADDFEPPIVMKVDTQGCEVRVFSGAERWLASVDYLICEYWPYGMHRIGDSQQAFIDFARRFAFGAQLSGNCPPAQLEAVAPLMERVRSIFCDPSNQLYVDLLLSRHPDFSCSASRSR